MQKRRFEELEGLRGVAAVVVAIYHFLLGFYLFAFFGPQGNSVQHFRLEDNFYGSIFASFFSGSFAVAIFFVLSGFVLSVGFYQSRKIAIIKKLAAKRYLRLMLPALASTLGCLFIISFGVLKIQEAGAITGSSWLLSSWNFAPSFFDALKSGVIDIFISGSSAYNNVLWTMAIEFAGSFLVFGYLALFGLQKRRWVGYGILLVATFNTWFFAFIAGMIIADLYTNNKMRLERRSWILLAPLLLLILWMGGYPVYGGDTAPLYGFLNQVASSVHWNIMLLTTGAILLMTAVLMVQQFAQFFSKKSLVVLGKYTFSLYLVHLPVLYTVGLSTFLFFYNTFGIGYNAAVLVAFVSFTLVTAGVAVLFERYVDVPSMALSSKFAHFLLKDEEFRVSAKKIKEYIWRVRRYNKPTSEAQPNNLKANLVESLPTE